MYFIPLGVNQVPCREVCESSAIALWRRFPRRMLLPPKAIGSGASNRLVRVQGEQST
jgi:hypothetical protein